MASEALGGLFWTIALVLADERFLKKWRPHLQAEALPRGPMRFILAAALEHWDAHQLLLDWPAYLFWLDKAVVDATLHREYRQTYLDLVTAYAVTESSYPTAWAAAEEWVQNYHVGMALDRARSALAGGDRATAFQELLGLHEVTGTTPAEPVTLELEGLADLLRRRRAACGGATRLGIEQLDDALEGGVLPGDLAIVAGPTNLGKSMFLCYLAASAYQQNRQVLYLTYELSRDEIAERIIMALFERGKHELNPETVAQELLSRRERWGVTVASVVIEEGPATVAELRHRLEQEPFDLVLLDSADDIVPRQTYPSLYLAQGEVYSDILLDICHGMTLPIWTSVQLNRESVERARVNLRHIGDSFKKVQRSTLCIGLSQSREEEDFYMGPVVKMWVLKDTKHGARGKWWRFLTKFGRGSKGWPGFEHYPERGELE